MEGSLVNLYDMCNRSVFSAAIRGFLGNYDSSLEEMMVYEKTLLFDSFLAAIASGLVPEIFLRKARAAQRFVGHYLATALLKDEMTDLARTMESDIQVTQATMMFVISWALNANSLPTIFWMIHFLLRDPDLKSRVLAEVYQVLRDEIGWEVQTATTLPKLTRAALNKMKLLHGMVHEALRMRSAIHLARTVMEDTVIEVNTGDPKHRQKFFIPKGHQIHTTNPHQDPEIFPEPDRVIPERFAFGQEHCDASGQLLAVPLMAFGHGVSTCIGRHFAKLEGPAAVVQLLVAFDWEAIHPEANEPQPDYTRYSFVMPIDSQQRDHPALQYRIRVKPQFHKS